MNRLIRDLTAIVHAILPGLPYLKKYRFRVVKANVGDQRWILQPNAKASGLDPIGPAEVHPGMAGLVAELAEGTEVIVSFVEGNPALPIIESFQAPDKPGWLPISLTIDASSTLKVGPSADLVEIGSGSEALVAPLEVGRPVRYGDVLVLLPALPSVPPAPATTNTPYVIGANQLGLPAVVAKVRA